MKHPTEEKFLKDVENHEINIIKDDGLYRHIRFKRPQTGNMYFDLITYPGGLLYRGDMGSFVFERVEDMFTFFRSSKNELGINPGYWGEKVKAESVFGNGMKEFDAEIWRNSIKEYWEEYFEDNQDSEEAKSVWEKISDQILCAEDADWDWVHRIHDFSPYGVDTKFNICDIWESLGDGKRVTYYYIWACYAVAWGVIQYDKEKL